jgi:hypothetical protein
VSATATGAVLALCAAVALNGSYLVQHAGSARAADVDVRRPLASLASLLRSPVWTLGAVAGCCGWALHIAAMREAPLSVVQAFVAGGLALAVPMAAFGLHRPVVAREVQAIALMALALALLALGLHDSGRHASFTTTTLAIWAGASVVASVLFAARTQGARRPLGLGIAGGLLYGAADLCLKAVTGLHGAAHIVLSPWLATGLMCTAGAFFAFQRGLQSERPVTVIALMTAATNVSSIAGAFAVFGDPLGSTPGLRIAHAVAFAVVIAAGWWLAPAAAPPAGV